MTKCSVLNCERPSRSKGLCDTHYRRSLVGCALDKPLRVRKYSTSCTATGCNRSPVSEGLCPTHLWRKKNNPIIFDAPVPFMAIGLRSGNWKGGEIIKDGRVLIICHGHPNPSHMKHYVYRYRLVMERHLKRYLSPDEIVHHKNEITTDDRIENLEVMSQSKHASLHFSKNNPNPNKTHVTTRK